LEIGLIAIIPVSFLLKLELGTGTNVPLNAAILMTAGLLGLWIFRMIVIDRSVFLFRTKVNKSALLFILATTMSLIFGNADWFIWAEYKASLPAQIGGWMLYTIPIGILLFTGNCLKNQQSLKRMVYLFLILGGIIILSRVPASTYQPILKYFVHSSQGAMLWLWLAALAVGQLLFNQSMAWKWRILLIILVASLLATNWMYGRKEWVSGWLPPLVAMFVIIWLRSWKMGILLTTTSGLAILLNYSLLNSEVMTDAQQYSTYSRFATLPIMFELFKASPLFGLGPANYHFYTPLYSLLGWQVQFNSHNNYVDILVQTGIVGMVIFMWLVIEIAKLTWRLRALTQDGFLSGYLAAAMGGLVGMLFSGLLGDWFLPFLYNIGIPGFRASIFAWIFLGGVIAIERFLNQPGVVVESS
jgi:O-antigen ligase